MASTGEAAASVMDRTMGDAEQLIAYVREAANELEKAHEYLDMVGVPRSVPGNEPVECTLIVRISLLLREGRR
jgi:hypothetical protein